MHVLREALVPDPGIAGEFQRLDPRLHLEWNPNVRSIVLYRRAGDRRHSRDDDRHCIEVFREADNSPRQPTMVDVERVREFDCGAGARTKEEVDRANEEATRKSKEYVRAQAHQERLEAARRNMRVAQKQEDPGSPSHYFDVGRKGPR